MAQGVFPRSDCFALVDVAESETGRASYHSAYQYYLLRWHYDAIVSLTCEYTGRRNHLWDRAGNQLPPPSMDTFIGSQVVILTLQHVRSEEAGEKDHARTHVKSLRATLILGT